MQWRAPEMKGPLSRFATRLPRFPLPGLLGREANNLDLVRLICAVLVIYGHTFIITPDPGYPEGVWDPFRRLAYPGVYASSVAVKVFFFVSGLLVTNSLLTRRSVSQYVIGRVFRIWPALFAVLLASVFIVGPALSNLPAREYFSRVPTYHYAAGNLMMWTFDQLPGVFAGNPLPWLVNGALWTLPYEVAAYLLLLAWAVLGIWRSRLLCLLLVLAIVCDPLLPQPFLFRWLGDNPQYTYLPPCFALGAGLAIFKDRVTISAGWCAAAITGFWLFRHSAAGPLLFYCSLFLTLLYVSGLAWFLRLRLPGDISYGTYLWGFLVQQIVASRFAAHGAMWNFAISLTATLLVASLSWRFVERPAIRWGSFLASRWSKTNPASPVPALPSPALFP